MKKLKLILLGASLLFIFSCSDTTSEFSTSEVEQIDKRQLINVNGPGWTPCEAANLQIFIPACLNATNAPTWNAGILDAIANFNAVPMTSLNITVTTVQGNADIVLNCFQSNSCFGGFVDSDFVNTGLSNTIDINTNLDLANCGCTPGGLDVCSAAFVIMHELAHAIGFFHNNSTHANAVLVDGTPNNNDPNSVINGGDIIDWCNMPCDLSNFDIVALQEVYPCGTPNFDIKWNGPVCFGDVVTFSLLKLPKCQKLQVTNWSVTSGGLSIMSSNSKFAIAEALSPGQSTICATAVNECGNEHTYCRIVTIKSDSQCGGDGDIPNPK